MAFCIYIVAEDRSPLSIHPYNIIRCCLLFHCTLSREFINLCGAAFSRRGQTEHEREIERDREREVEVCVCVCVCLGKMACCRSQICFSRQMGKVCVCHPFFSLASPLSLRRFGDGRDNR